MRGIPEKERDYQLGDQALAGRFQDALQISGAAQEPVPPSWLDDDFSYCLEDFVGRGGSGFVWKARHQESSRMVALKVIPFDGDLSVARERWLREAEVASAVKHPHLLGIHEKGLSPDGESAWIALEWIEGLDLHRLLVAEGVFKWRTLMSWIPDLCAALSALHGRSLVHRDLKPSNFLLEKSSGRLVISDFGAALPIELDRVTRTTDALVSFGYAAPEQLKPGHEIDGRADQYSLAVTLWELLTAEIPMGSYPKLRSLSADSPRWLDAVLRKAMSAAPDNRYPDMQSFAHALTGIPSRRRFIFQTGLASIALAGSAWTAVKLIPVPEVVTLEPKTFRSGSLRVVEGIGVYIEMNVTVQPDGFITILVISRSQERWRGMKTRGAFALLDENGEAMRIILSHTFGVTGQIRPGNGSSRSDYLEAWVPPEEAGKVVDIKFMVHPDVPEDEFPWVAEYPDIPMDIAKGTQWRVDRENDAKKKAGTYRGDGVHHD